MKLQAASSARRRGSSAGNAKGSGTRSSKQCATQSPPSSGSPNPLLDVGDATALHEALSRGAIREYANRAAGVMPSSIGRKVVTGEIAKRLQSALSAHGDKLTPLQFFLTVMQQPDMPYLLRAEAAHEALPYMHPRNPEPPQDPSERRSVLVVPQQRDMTQWEAEAAEYQKQLSESEKLRAEAAGSTAPEDQS